jgi:hypothetical protein
MEHSVLENIPRLAPDQLESLRESIARRGLMEPLDVVPNPEHEGAYLIIDGRHRFEILRKANQPIPCIVSNEKDPLDFAIDKAVQGRQLTKSGVVLMLFLNHPDLADKRARAARTKAGVEPLDSIKTYADIARTYRVPPEYFTKLASIHDRCTDEEWEEVKIGIFQKDSAITALNAGSYGRDACKGKRRTSPHYHALARASLATVANAFGHWGEIKLATEKQRLDMEKRILTALTVMPDEVKGYQIGVIVEKWHLNHKAALFNQLKVRIAKERKEQRKGEVK